MTKADLIEGLANKLGMGKGEAERTVNIVLDDIVNALKQGERVNISGFGTFSVSSRQARTGRNPKTGESIEISASRSAKFKAGKQLKDSLNTSETTPQPSSPTATD
jgi:DNA-binding protein HU-beta